jgi:hypothetical protein
VQATGQAIDFVVVAVAVLLLLLLLLLSMLLLLLMMVMVMQHPSGAHGHPRFTAVRAAQM